MENETPKLATVERIVAVEKHPNADLLDIVQVKGFRAIVKRGQYKVGDLAVFIQPDTVLPDAPWAAFYKAKSSRVKAIKLRDVWSEGIVELPETVGYNGDLIEGANLTQILGITKYEPPLPQDLAAKGGLPFGICKTDEERWENLDIVHFGSVVDVTLKIDGQSSSYYWSCINGEVVQGVLGRTLEFKLDAVNNYTQNQANLDILNKLSAFCRKNGIADGLCLRGESYGKGIQKFSHNPHAKQNLGWAMFSTWLIRERKHAYKDHPLYFIKLANELRLPTVPILEENVVLTKELIKKYAEDLELINGQPFEGVVIKGNFGSFKVINKSYDSKKGK